MTMSSRFTRSSATLLSPKGRFGALTIVIYHRVLRAPDPMVVGELTCDAFADQMQLMAEEFNVLPLSEGVARLQRGDLPSRAACITFDDGYRDNAEVAVPVLKEYGLCSTFFVSTGFLDGGRMWNDTIIEFVRQAPGDALDLSMIGGEPAPIATMDQRRQVARELVLMLRRLSYDERSERVAALIGDGSGLRADLMMTSVQVKELLSQGMEVGAHTVTHPILSRLDQGRAYKEIEQSKANLEHVLGERVSLFAYPNGKPGKDYGVEHVRMVRKLGFDAAVSTSWGAARKGADILQLPRFRPWHDDSKRFHQGLIRNYLRRIEQLDR